MFETEQVVNKGIFNTYIIVFLIVFFAGLMNSKDYFNFMGFNNFNFMISICFYLLFFTLFFLYLINNLFVSKKYFLNGVSYWIVLLSAVFLKFYILFVQNPSWLLPGGGYFYNFFEIIVILLVGILFSGILQNLKGIRVAIWGLGLGAIFSALIPLLLFPEMIGSRSSEVQGYFFNGAFWNSSVISYISVGWLLVSLASIERSRIKKYFLISFFLLLAFGGIAGLSRATLFSVSVSVCVYLLFAKSLKKSMKIILLGIVLLFSVINLFPDLIFSFGERLEGGIDVEDEARTKIWIDYLAKLPSYLLFGAIDGDYKKYSVYGMGPHSTALNWLVQYGLLGLIGFILLVIGLLKSIKEIQKHFSAETTSALYAWVASYLSVALMNETGFKQLTVFIAFGIILAWGNISRRLSKEKIKE